MVDNVIIKIFPYNAFLILKFRTSLELAKFSGDNDDPRTQSKPIVATILCTFNSLAS